MRWTVLLAVAACATAGVPPPPRGEARCWVPNAAGARAEFRVTGVDDGSGLSSNVVAYEDGTVLTEVTGLAGTQSRVDAVPTPKIERARERFRGRTIASCDPAQDQRCCHHTSVTLCWLQNGDRKFIQSQDDAIQRLEWQLLIDLGVDAWVTSALRARPSHDAGH